MVLFGTRRLRLEGERALAVVLSCESRGGRRREDLREYDYVVEVRTADRQVFEASVRDRFWAVDLRPKEGDADVPVRFDPASHETVFDLEGDPRFDRRRPPEGRPGPDR
jgi:hypothetical protein